MYLTILLVDTGTNPDRPRPGRQWLRNRYRVHQRLSMAFPDERILELDPFYLDSFKPENFTKERFLYRIDALPQATVIVVQSILEPNWDFAFKNAEHFLGAVPIVKKYNPVFVKGNQYSFKVLVNMAKKVKRVDPSGVVIRTKRFDDHGNEIIDKGNNSKRVPLVWDKIPDSELIANIQDWFIQKVKVKDAGFSIDAFNLVQMSKLSARKPKLGFEQLASPEKFLQHNMLFHTALIEGSLIVESPEKVLQTVQSGIGSGKAFGLGMLSIHEVK